MSSLGDETRRDSTASDELPVSLIELSLGERSFCERVASGCILNRDLVQAAKINPRSREAMEARVLLHLDLGLWPEALSQRCHGALTPGDVVEIAEQWRRDARRPEPVVPRSDAPASDTLPLQRRQRRASPGDARIKILSALRSLTDNGEWGRNGDKIAKRAGVARSTCYRHLRTDRAVMRAMDVYRKQSRGRGPCSASDL
jgi:hypothetical protein